MGIIGFLIVSAIGLMLYALNDSIDLFYTPSEIIEGKKVRADTEDKDPWWKKW